MKLSTRSRYGLRVMVNLAARGHFCSVREIAREEQVSYVYLEKILTRLKKAGLVRVQRGSRGGYALKRSADKITAGEIVTVLEGPLNLVSCTSNQKCSRQPKCPTRPLWVKLENTIKNSLNSVSLQSLIG